MQCSKVGVKLITYVKLLNLGDSFTVQIESIVRYNRKFEAMEKHKGKYYITRFLSTWVISFGSFWKRRRESNSKIWERIWSASVR